jgi:hypothetical protein
MDEEPQNLCDILVLRAIVKGEIGKIYVARLEQHPRYYVGEKGDLFLRSASITLSLDDPLPENLCCDIKGYSYHPLARDGGGKKTYELLSDAINEAHRQLRTSIFFSDERESLDETTLEQKLIM